MTAALLRRRFAGIGTTSLLALGLLAALPAAAQQPQAQPQAAAPAAAASAPSTPSSKALAAGFTALPAGANLLVMVPDVELFSISGGGVMEPKADWTETAQRFIDASLQKQLTARKLTLRKSSEQEADEFHELSSLHAAIAGAISLHHVGPFKLPTKNGVLDWSLGDAVKPLYEKSGVDYALFLWMRDSYASAERKAAMVALAMLGIGIPGGIQVGYASLVDLRTGQVMWFNQLARMSGDLREATPAEETVKALLTDFPAAK